MAMPRIGGRTLQFGEQGYLAAHEGLDVALIGGDQQINIATTLGVVHP
jgi:hypothetical protein